MPGAEPPDSSSDRHAAAQPRQKHLPVLEQQPKHQQEQLHRQLLKQLLTLRQLHRQRQLQLLSLRQLHQQEQEHKPEPRLEQTHKQLLKLLLSQLQ